MKIESFNWVIDANHDGNTSLTEMWHTLQWLYMVPGNLVVEALGHIPITVKIFHIQASEQVGYYSLNSWFSALFSFFFWLFVLVELSNLKDVIKRRMASRHTHAKTRFHHTNP